MVRDFFFWPVNRLLDGEYHKVKWASRMSGGLGGVGGAIVPSPSKNCFCISINQSINQSLFKHGKSSVKLIGISMHFVALGILKGTL